MILPKIYTKNYNNNLHTNQYKAKFLQKYQIGIKKTIIKSNSLNSTIKNPNKLKVLINKLIKLM